MSSPAVHLMDLTLFELTQVIQSGHVTPLQSILACFERIDERNPTLNAFVSLCVEEALEEAEKQTELLKKGISPGPLAGVPLAVKDLEDCRGLPTTYGVALFQGDDKQSRPASKTTSSKYGTVAVNARAALKNVSAPLATKDSITVERLRKAGAIPVGKVNTSALGSRAITKNILFGPTYNPWRDTESREREKQGQLAGLFTRSSAGSSGGSATAIAGRMCPLVTASDAGGSIRMPASFVGAFGFKPTFGLIPFPASAASSVPWLRLSHMGPITRTVQDASIFMDIVTRDGPHPADPYSLPRLSTEDNSFSSCLRELFHSRRKLRVAFSADLGYVDAQPLIVTAVRDAAMRYAAAAGHDFVDVTDTFSLPDFALYYNVLLSAQTNCLWGPTFKGKEDLLERFQLAAWQNASRLITPALIGSYMKNFRLYHDTVAELFKKFDVLITPTTPGEPYHATGRDIKSNGPTRTKLSLDGIATNEEERKALEEQQGGMILAGYCYPWNFLGMPSCSVRAGLSPVTGLPIGLQMTTNKYEDRLLMQIAYQYEQLLNPFDSWPDFPKGALPEAKL